MPDEPPARTLDRLFALLPSGVEADARLNVHRFGTMRFANGRIHQPHLDLSRVLSLRVAIDRRLGIATSSDVTPDGLRAIVDSACALARVAPKEAKFPGFPAPSYEKAPKTAFSRPTATLSPEAQVRLAEHALEGARSVLPDARISGAVNTGEEAFAVGNTAGLRTATRRSVAQCSILVERPKEQPPVSGWAEGAHWNVAALHPDRLGREAAERVPRSPPKPARPGKHRVLLTAPAAAELLSSIAYLGFGGRAEEEGWSALRGKRGKRVVAPEITLTDDGSSPESIPQSIDHEGHSKRPTPLFTEGVAGPVVSDLLTAARLGLEPSGHGLPPESPWGEWGPVPTQLLLSPGTASFDELVKETRRGILVTRFHYVRVVHPGKSIITGMTRDGTYRIEGGEIVAPVLNLRFTESVLDTLRATELVGRESRRFTDERGFSSATCPAIVAGGFRFTSATVF